MNKKLNLIKGVATLAMAIFLILFPTIVSAHPGNTAADGCHYCRTNCDYWDVPWNQRHCHNSYASNNSETNDNNSSENYNWIWWILGGGFVVYLIWLSNKKE